MGWPLESARNESGLPQQIKSAGDAGTGGARRETLLEQSRFVVFTVAVPESDIIALDSSKLPAGWEKYQQQEETQAIGAAFLDPHNGFPLLMTVPSILTGEDNALFNPDHPCAAALIATATSAPFAIDRRIKDDP